MDKHILFYKLQEKKLWLACETQDGVSAAQEAIRNNANVNWENPEDKVSTSWSYVCVIHWCFVFFLLLELYTTSQGYYILQ